MVVVSDSTRMEGRSRLSRESVERHVSHEHPTSGTPVEVPLPRTVIFIDSSEISICSERIARGQGLERISADFSESHSLQESSSSFFIRPIPVFHTFLTHGALHGTNCGQVVLIPPNQSPSEAQSRAIPQTRRDAQNALRANALWWAEDTDQA